MGRVSLRKWGNSPGPTAPGHGPAEGARPDCPAVDGRRVPFWVGFVLGGVLRVNIIHRPPAQSMFHVSNQNLQECTGCDCKCRDPGGKRLSRMSTVVNARSPRARGPAGGVY